MGNEDLNFVPNKELDKEILIPIPRESKIGKDCDFPSCDDFQSFKTFSNPLFEKQDDFPSRNDESILKEEVHKETFKSYLNPLFEDDEEIISNEASSIISPKIDVKTIIKTKEVFETKVEPEKKKELQVFHPDIEILDHLETNSYVGSDYVFYEDFNLVDMIFPMNIQGKIFDPGITFHEKSFEKYDKSSKELAQSKALLTLDVFDPPNPPLMTFNRKHSDGVATKDKTMSKDQGSKAIHHYEPRSSEIATKGLLDSGFVVKGVCRDNPPTLAARWGFELRTPVLLDILLVERPNRGSN
ncbi:hypothetical protein Tco_0833758 [Tanacetum coccineum]